MESGNFEDGMVARLADDLPVLGGSDPASSRDTENFTTLDGLRGIAALSVAVGHGRFLAAGKPIEFFSESYLAVDFFFLLSGFILAHAYGNRLLSGMSVARFMVMRLIRLYPLYLLAFLSSLALAAIQGFHNSAGVRLTLSDALFSLFMLPVPDRHEPLYPLNIPELLYPLNIPAWSLFFELVANFVFALASKRFSIGGLLVLTGAAATVMMLALKFSWLGFGTQADPFSAGVSWPSVGGGLARVTVSFFAGVLAFRLWKYPSPRRHVPPMIFVTLLFVIMALVPARNIQIGYDLLVTLLVFPLLVFWGASSIPGKFAGRVFTWIGGISYGVYVLQQAYYTIVMATTAAVTGHDFAGLSSGGLVIALLLLLPLATLAHSYFDLPVRQRLTKFLNMKRPLKLPAGNAA